MTELLFWETTIGKRPVSFAIDIVLAFALGVQWNSLADKPLSSIWGWYDLSIYLGPFILTFTVYGRDV